MTSLILTVGITKESFAFTVAVSFTFILYSKVLAEPSVTRLNFKFVMRFNKSVPSKALAGSSSEGGNI